MKTANDPRHEKRIRLMQELFSYGFRKDQPEKSPGLRQILSKIDEIDKNVHKSAPMWPVERINKLDLAILRLAVFELLIEKKAPPKVIVDEAVELAKEYGSEASPAFINGALGKLIEENRLL